MLELASTAEELKMRKLKIPTDKQKNGGPTNVKLGHFRTSKTLKRSNVQTFKLHLKLMCCWLVTTIANFGNLNC